MGEEGLGKMLFVGIASLSRQAFFSHLFLSSLLCYYRGVVKEEVGEESVGVRLSTVVYVQVYKSMGLLYWKFHTNRSLFWSISLFPYYIFLSSIQPVLFFSSIQPKI